MDRGQHRHRPVRAAPTRLAERADFWRHDHGGPGDCYVVHRRRRRHHLVVIVVIVVIVVVGVLRQALAARTDEEGQEEKRGRIL